MFTHHIKTYSKFILLLAVLLPALAAAGMAVSAAQELSTKLETRHELPELTEFDGSENAN